MTAPRAMRHAPQAPTNPLPRPTVSFVSLTFLAFFGLFLLLYRQAGSARQQNVLTVLGSYAFYAWWDYRFCALMLISSLSDYVIGRALDRGPPPSADADADPDAHPGADLDPDPAHRQPTSGTRAPRPSPRRKALLATSLAINLGMLGFFKYFNFFVENAAALLQALGMQPSEVTLRIVLPVGISFYTFQTLSYTIDIYRGQLRAERDLWAYLAFVSFFPQLVAGPIERARNLLPQFKRMRAFDPTATTLGLQLILWGLFKKMVIADNLAVLVDPVFARPETFSGLFHALAAVGFAFQIYCDFSGYADIAVGLGRILGIRLMTNFEFPYFSRNVAEFWRRWHISLSTWFRDYVYIPLGGSRHGAARTAFAVLATFTVSGLWHGASWNFVIWGTLNGAATLPLILRASHGATRRTGGPGAYASVVARILATFLFTCLLWIFFRARNLQTAGISLQQIFTAFWPESFAAETTVFPRKLVFVIVGAIGGLIVAEAVARFRPELLARWRRWRFVRWAAYSALIWGIIVVGTRQTGSFIYFQF